MKLLIVGAGGYGATYLKPLLDGLYPKAVIEGIVDPFVRSCALYDRISEAGIPLFDTMEDFYRNHSADLAVISTPTYLHCEQCLCALQNGSHVLCEKPAAPTANQVQEMIEAEKKYGRFIAIGFQWSFSDAIQTLKQDILDGKLGNPIRLRTMIQWPRTHAYYSRGGGWGGRQILNGKPVYDSIASNACAHYLHNMLFVLGKEMHSSAMPETMQAECLRANPIENFDTCSLKMHFKEGYDAFFIASHATESTRNPIFSYEFSKAVVTFSADEGSEIIARFADGREKNYGNPFNEERVKKLTDCMHCVENNRTPVCTVSTAYPHASLIDRLQEHIEISPFPADLLCEDAEKTRIYVDGLSDVMDHAYQNDFLFSEAGYDFTKTISFDCMKR